MAEVDLLLPTRFRPVGCRTYAMPPATRLPARTSCAAAAGEVEMQRRACHPLYPPPRTHQPLIFDDEGVAHPAGRTAIYLDDAPRSSEVAEALPL